jgi:hypothetical protein
MECVERGPTGPVIVTIVAEALAVGAVFVELVSATDVPVTEKNKGNFSTHIRDFFGCRIARNREFQVEKYFITALFVTVEPVEWHSFRTGSTPSVKCPLNDMQFEMHS